MIDGPDDKAQFAQAFEEATVTDAPQAKPEPADEVAMQETLVQSLEQKPMSFKEAFRAARKAGGKLFEWNGKKYTTDMAKPKAAPAKVAAASTPTVAPEEAKTVVQPSKPVVRPSVYGKAREEIGDAISGVVDRFAGSQQRINERYAAQREGAK